MQKLVIPEHVFSEIVHSLHSMHGVETGVTLFGTSLTERPTSLHVVLAIAGAGRGATHEPTRYSGDENHSNAIFDALRSALPTIRWLGELHLHPHGMPALSFGDLRTVREILAGNDATLHPSEFIAGVMQCREALVDVYPFHFTRSVPEGEAMQMQLVSPDDSIVRRARLQLVQKGNDHDRSGICTEPQGSRTARPQTPRHRWLRKWWQRRGRDGCKGRNRRVHPGRS